MTDKLRVCYLHPWVHNVEDIKRSLKIEGTDIADNFVWDDENPDYLFAGDALVSFPEYWEKFKRLAGKAAVRIYTAGEAIAPDLNIFDYAIVFDRKLCDMDRIARKPAMVFFRSCLRPGTENTFTESEAHAKLEGGLRFCNFVYSNGSAHPCRDNLFYALSGYKRVDSLGGHLNNVNTLITGGADGLNSASRSRAGTSSR